MMLLSIVQITDWRADQLEELMREGEAEGFRFLKRLRAEWLSGVNRFSNTGEAFFGVFDDESLVAVGGIGRPKRSYSDETQRDWTSNMKMPDARWSRSQSRELAVPLTERTKADSPSGNAPVRTPPKTLPPARAMAWTLPR